MDDCFASVRGSALRVTSLSPRGSLLDTIEYATCKAVSKVSIDPVAESGGNEVQRSPVDEPRLHLITNEQLVRFNVDTAFLKVDPGVLTVMTGVPVVLDYFGNAVGFDATTRLPVKSFALEVWSKLTGKQAIPRRWGYTLFPFLRGGYISGVTFDGGLASFSVKGAKTQRHSKWGVGPWDVYGPYQRLEAPVSRNGHYRMITTTLAPPAPVNGIQTFLDVIYGGDAAGSTADVINGGNAPTTTPWIIDGGTAS